MVEYGENREKRNSSVRSGCQGCVGTEILIFLDLRNLVIIWIKFDIKCTWYKKLHKNYKIIDRNAEKFYNDYICENGHECIVF